MDFIIGNIRGILGMVVFLAITYLLSTNKKAIDWKLVRTGILFQLAFAFLVFFTPVSHLLKWFSQGFVFVIQATNKATTFVMGDAIMGLGFSFAFNVLPTIIVFSVISSFLYYIGFLQKVVFGLAWLLNKTMRLSGAESLAVAANVFLGQTEAPLMVKPYLERMTKSEVLCLMTGGMATIAGGVFAAYMQILGGDPVAYENLILLAQSNLDIDPSQLLSFQQQLGIDLDLAGILALDAKSFANEVITARQIDFGKHLFTASIISAPAAIVAAKILFPEENPELISRDMHVPKDRIGSNVLDALTIGTTEGLKLAVNVGGMLLAFMALIYLVNNFLFVIGDIHFGSFSLNDFVNNSFPAKAKDGSVLLTESGQVIGKFGGFQLEFIMGTLLSPVAWLLGADWSDCMLLGQLLGKKTILNEFVAYSSLGEEMGKMGPKSVIIATYALCGFANFASIGIQIGGIGSLAPNQRAVLSQFGLKSLIGGTVACFLTACIAGMLVEWEPILGPISDWLDSFFGVHS